MTPKGKLLIIGGAEDKGDDRELGMKEENAQFEHYEILKELLQNGDGRIELITTPSRQPEEVKRMYQKIFKKIGFDNVGFIHIDEKEEARNLTLVKRIEAADAVMFSGGDQSRLSTILGGTPLAEAIYKQYQEEPNFIVAGTSAGAMAMSEIMISEGGTQEALLDKDIKTTAGLRFIENCIIDTHFIKRGRFGRLAHAIMINPGHLGIGLGEDTALIIKKGYEAECRGSGMVVIIDGNEIGQTNVTEVEDKQPVYVERLIVHLLVKGCHFNLQTRELADPAISPRTQARMDKQREQAAQSSDTEQGKPRSARR